MVIFLNDILTLREPKAIDGLRKTGDAPGHKPRLLLLVVLRFLVVVVVVVVVVVSGRARARAKTPLQKASFWRTRARVRGTLKRDSNKKSKPKPWYLHYFFNMLKTKFITKGMNMRNTHGIP